VDLAYAEAAWVVHYLESVHGVRSLHEMVRAFARGRTTEEAVREVLGMSVAELDRAVWAWCLRDAPDVWPTRLVRYDEELGGLIRRSESPDRLADRLARDARRRVERHSERGPAESLEESRARGDARPTMAAWHADYTRKVAGFKSSLSGVLGRLRQVRPPQPIACVTLSGQVNRILQDTTALHPPDPTVARPLRTAFRHFSTMAEACSREETTAAHASLLRAERALAQAAQAMQRHGLKP
jgi:hypothetical protein